MKQSLARHPSSGSAVVTHAEELGHVVVVGGDEEDSGSDFAAEEVFDSMREEKKEAEATTESTQLARHLSCPSTAATHAGARDSDLTAGGGGDSQWLSVPGASGATASSGAGSGLSPNTLRKRGVRAPSPAATFVRVTSSTAEGGIGVPNVNIGGVQPSSAEERGGDVTDARFGSENGTSTETV